MYQLRFKGLSVFLAIAFLLANIAINPSAGAAQDQVELRVWDQFTDEVASSAADSIYAQFMEANPGIKITREVIQTDQMRQTVNTAISSGTGPDVIFYDAGAGYAGVLATAGLLEPLDAYATQYKWGERIVPSALDATSINDQLYGMPLQTDLIGTYYNKTLIDQEGLTLPTTLPELLTFCQQASEKGYIPLAFTDNPGWQGFHQFSMVTNNMIGPDAMQQLLFQNQGSWTSPEIIQAIQNYFVDMRDARCFSDDVNALTNDDGVALFQSGQALMYPTGSWMASELNAETMPDQDVQMMPFPALDGGQGSYWVSGVGSAFYISALSEHKSESASFIDFLFQPAAANQWVQDAGFFLPMGVDTSGMTIPPLRQAILSELAKALDGSAEFGYNVDVIAPAAFNETLQNGIQQILAGDLTAEQLAAQIQETWDKNWQPQATPPASPVS